jgi:hypothetical protein
LDPGHGEAIFIFSAGKRKQMLTDTDREQETIEGLAFASPEVDWLSPLSLTSSPLF